MLFLLETGCRGMEQRVRELEIKVAQHEAKINGIENTIKEIKAQGDNLQKWIMTTLGAVVISSLGIIASLLSR